MPTEMLKLRRLTIPNVGNNMEELELLYIVGRNAKWFNHFGKMFDNFFKN